MTLLHAFCTEHVWGRRRGYETHNSQSLVWCQVWEDDWFAERITLSWHNRLMDFCFWWFKQRYNVLLVLVLVYLIFVSEVGRARHIEISPLERRKVQQVLWFCGMTGFSVCCGSEIMVVTAWALGQQYRICDAANMLHINSKAITGRWQCAYICRNSLAH